MRRALEAIANKQEVIDQLQAEITKIIQARNTLIREAYKDGATIAELSRTTGVSRNTIYKIVQTRKH